MEKASSKKREVKEIAFEKLVKHTSSDDEEFVKLSNYFEKSLPPDAKLLSDYAISRGEIYKDHL